MHSVSLLPHVLEQDYLYTHREVAVWGMDCPIMLEQDVKYVMVSLHIHNDLVCFTNEIAYLPYASTLSCFYHSIDKR